MVWLFLFLAVTLVGGTGILSYMMRGMFREMWADGAIGKTLFLIMTACFIVLGGTGFYCGNEAYIRFTTTQSQETITVITANSRLVMIPIVHSTGKTTWVQMVSTWQTKVTCEEYPGQTFAASGNHDWAQGTKVPITFYLRHGERIRYDFESSSPH